GEGDEADAQREDAFAARIGGAGRAERRPLRYGEEDQEQTKKEEGEEIDGSQAQADASRLEEESDLPRRRRRHALAARRQVHRDRRPLQPTDRPVDDRVRRGQGQGLALEGRTAVRHGQAPAQGEEHWLNCSPSWRGGSSTIPTRCTSRRSSAKARTCCSCTWRRTTSAR